MTKERSITSDKNWYKTWWGILLILGLWPFFLSCWIWKRNWNLWVRVSVVALLWVLILAINRSSIRDKVPLLTSISTSTPSPLVQVSLTPTPIQGTPPSTHKKPTLASTPTPKPSLEPTAIPAPESSLEKEIVMGDTPEAIAFYKKLKKLYNQGLINGELYGEFKTDPIVALNPKTNFLDVGLKYDSIESNVDSEDKALILEDFYSIKSLAEEDENLLEPGYRVLRYFVISFHDQDGIYKGEISQMMIDDEPEWFFD